MEKRKVPTNKNTNFADWLELVKEECARLGVDFHSANELKHKHAWEFSNTPASWVDILRRRALRRERENQIFDDRNLFKDYVR